MSPARELLGSPGRRSHEKGTTEVAVVVRGDGAGDDDGEKEETVDTEEDDEADEEVRLRRRGTVDGVDGSERGGGGSGSGIGCGLLVWEARIMRETRELEIGR